MNKLCVFFFSFRGDACAGIVSEVTWTTLFRCLIFWETARVLYQAVAPFCIPESYLCQVPLWLPTLFPCQAHCRSWCFFHPPTGLVMVAIFVVVYIFSCLSGLFSEKFLSPSCVLPQKVQPLAWQSRKEWQWFDQGSLCIFPWSLANCGSDRITFGSQLPLIAGHSIVCSNDLGHKFLHSLNQLSFSLFAWVLFEASFLKLVLTPEGIFLSISFHNSVKFVSGLWFSCCFHKTTSSLWSVYHCCSRPQSTTLTYFS